MDNLFSFFCKASKNELVRSIAGDTISFLLPPGIPISTISWGAFKIYKLMNKDVNFVDWQLKEWSFIYHKELDNALNLQYKGTLMKLPQVITLDNTQKQYEVNKFHFIQEKGSFVVENQYRGITEKAYSLLLESLNKKRTFNNGLCIRLKKIEFDDLDSSYILTTQAVRYEQYLRSNLTLDAKLNNSNSLRQTIHNNGTLESLEHSPLANNFGINILAFTADYGLIVQQRGEKVAFRRGEYCPSGSGTLDDQDLPENNIRYSGEQIVRGLLRELTEEIGIDKESIRKYFILGITRELIRGGQPELFMVAYTNHTEEDVEKEWKQAKDRHELEKFSVFRFDKGLMDKNVFDEEDVIKFGLEVDRCIENYFEKASLPFLTAIALWKKYILELKRKKA